MPQGKVTRTIFDRNWNIVSVEETTNLFLSSGYDVVMALLAKSGTAYVSNMQFGSGSTLPAIGDTVLQTPISPIKPISDKVYDDANFKVTLTSYLLAYEGNGFDIGEAGLLSPSNELIARSVFTSSTKTEDYIFTFEWELYF
jgi:hypothetical protein